MSKTEREKASIKQISTLSQREILVSKWRSLPSLYWSIVVGILTVFSVLQTTLLARWSSREVIWLLVVLMGLAFVSAIGIAMKQVTPTEKLALARALHTEAGCRFDERNYVEAEDAAKRSVELYPENSMSWSLLGRIQIRLGKPTDAVYAFENAIDVNRRSEWRTIYIHNRAVARIFNRDYGHARNDLNACIADKPHSWVSLRWRALVCYYMEDFSAAFIDVESCVRESPNRIPNQAVLAIIAKNAGKADQAAKATETALSLRPERAEDYYYIAALKGSLGRRDEAIKLLGLSMQLDDKMKSRAFFDPLWDYLRKDNDFTKLIELNSDNQVML